MLCNRTMDMEKEFPRSTASFNELARIFSYNRAHSLDIRDEGEKVEDGIIIHDVSYAGFAQERIPAFLVEPLGEGTRAGIVFVHPGPGNRSTFLDEAKQLAGKGASCLLINAPRSDGSRFASRVMVSSDEELRSWYIQMVVDFYRSVDLLTTSPQVDAHRIGYVGHSFGALFGGILAGVDTRITSFVLTAGVGSFTDVALLNIPSLAGERLKKFRAVMDPVDPIHYFGHAPPSAIFFQFGTDDTFFTRQKFLDFFDAAGNPKLISWYEADHYLNSTARRDRCEWLSTRLNLSLETPV